MNNREKIITALAGLAVLVGGVIFLLDASPPPAPPPDAAGQDTAAIRQEITTALGGLRVTEKQRAGAAAINRPWAADPFFLRTETTPVAGVDGEAPELLFSYTGYLEMGNMRLAIINGQEYQERERLDIPGFRLWRIYPDRVLISSDRRDTPVVIPYEEAEGTL